MWPQDKPLVPLLPSAMLMTPAECKHWMKTHTVRMFNHSMYCTECYKTGLCIPNVNH